MDYKLTRLDYLLLLGTALLAAYQVVIGIDGLGNFVYDTTIIICYTIGFGLILVSSLLLLIMGYEILGTPPVVILGTMIPLSISTGLVAQFLPTICGPIFLWIYLLFDAVGLATIIFTRYFLPAMLDDTSRSENPAWLVLAGVHTISGLVIFLLPIFVIWKGYLPAGFGMVGVGGALFGLVGILLSFLRAGVSPIPLDKVARSLAWVLLLTTAAFLVGFSYA